MPYVSVSVKWMLECRSCGAGLPVNRVSEEFLCTECGQINPIPRVIWQKLIVPEVIEAIAMDEESDRSSDGMWAGLGNYSVEYGRMTPRCENGCGVIWNLDELIELAEKNTPNITCKNSGKIHSLRTAPSFLKELIPFVKYVIGEESPEADGVYVGGEEGISIYCYHCGGQLPLDGSSRKVKCRYCGQDLLIPDDIWQRLNPVISAHYWYLLLDTGEHVDLLPDDIDDFLDQEEHSVLCFQTDTGKLVYNINNENGTGITAQDHDGIAIQTDGTIVINRRWENKANESVSFIVKAGKLFYPDGYSAQSKT